MSTLQELVQQYSALRDRGVSAGKALEQLRERIISMSKSDQTEIVRQVRLIEAMHKSSDEYPTPKPNSALIFSDIPSTPPRQQTLQSPREDVVVPIKSAYMGIKTSNCPRCGKPNPVDEVLCAHCGNFLLQGKSAFETARLEDDKQPDTSFYNDDSTLVLMMRDSNFAFKLRPQDNRHDIVIGRSNGASMKPDIDLLDHNGDQGGVSRLHLSIRYEARDKTVCVVDMNSANGSFLNGQKLHPREVRVIRHGDELRLGRLVMRVYFQHGTGLTPKR